MQPGNIGKRLKQAFKKEAKYAIILGEDEIKSGQLVLKNLSENESFETKEQRLTFDALVPILKQ
jgi:histidyl-tRNA synthetase